MTDCNMPISTLSDWVDRDTSQPLSPAHHKLAHHIDSCPECTRKIASLSKLHDLAATALDRETQEQEADTSWVDSLLNNLVFEARSGRSIPLEAPSERVRLSQSEGAVVAAARAVADRIEGVMIGRCRLVGDVQTYGAPVTVQVTVSVCLGQQIPLLIQLLREALTSEFSRVSELNITGIDITVQDLHTKNQEVEAA